MKIKYVIILLLVFITLSTFQISIAEDNNIVKVEEFIDQIYKDYLTNNFKNVYLKFHPDLKKILSLESYMEFQTSSTKKYNLKLFDVEILDIKVIEKLPEEFKEMITVNKEDILYEIALKYKTTFVVGQVEQKKTIEKKSYVLNDNKNNFYLLWNPNVIEKSKNG